MMETDDDYGNGTELFSNSEIDALKRELTALQDVIGAIQACEHSSTDIKPALKRKTAIIEKLQKENRRVLECSAKLEELRRWRDLRAHRKSERQLRQPESII